MFCNVDLGLINWNIDSNRTILSCAFTNLLKETDVKLSITLHYRLDVWRSLSTLQSAPLMIHLTLLMKPDLHLLILQWTMRQEPYTVQVTWFNHYADLKLIQFDCVNHNDIVSFNMNCTKWFKITFFSQEWSSELQ